MLVNDLTMMFLFPHREREASVAPQELKETEYVALLSLKNSTPSLSHYYFSTSFGSGHDFKDAVKEICQNSPWMIYCTHLFSFQGS